MRQTRQTKSKVEMEEESAFPDWSMDPFSIETGPGIKGESPRTA